MRYLISHYILDFSVGEARYQIEEVYNVPSQDGWECKGREHDIGSIVERVQFEASKDLE